jgi:hypothetical protein
MWAAIATASAASRLPHDLTLTDKDFMKAK